MTSKLEPVIWLPVLVTLAYMKVCLSECDKIAKWQFFMSRYIFLNQVFYIHGKFLYIHVKTVSSLSMRLASYQVFFFSMSIYVHNFHTSRRTGDELGLETNVVFGSLERNRHGG